MSYDLGDASKWEFFFVDVEKPLLIVPGEEPHLDDEQEDSQVRAGRWCCCMPCVV